MPATNCLNYCNRFGRISRIFPYTYKPNNKTNKSLEMVMLTTAFRNKSFYF